MPSTNPRINVQLDLMLYKNIRFLAKKDGVSLSAKVRELLKEASEIHEDIYLASFAEKREETWDESTSLNHEEVWS
ncbi:Toxin-antitoxin system, antitoxin component [Candidatus Magnetomoraceae bacterium gMMP-15]